MHGMKTTITGRPNGWEKVGTDDVTDTSKLQYDIKSQFLHALIYAKFHMFTIINTHTHTHTHIYIYKTERLADRQQADGRTDRQVGRQGGRETDIYR
jgi:hypothetical protein